MVITERFVCFSVGNVDKLCIVTLNCFTPSLGIVIIPVTANGLPSICFQSISLAQEALIWECAFVGMI